MQGKNGLLFHIFLRKITWLCLLLIIGGGDCWIPHSSFTKSVWTEHYDSKRNHHVKESLIRQQMIPSTASFISSCSTFGGRLQRVQMEGEDDGFLAANTVPTFAAWKEETASSSKTKTKTTTATTIKMEPYVENLDSVIPGAFVIYNALSEDVCNDIIQVCEDDLKFGTFDAGKNHHGALQVLVSQSAADNLGTILYPFVQRLIIDKHPGSNFAGVNRRWRCYRYEPGSQQHFAPHIDCGFPPSALSKDGTTMIWDARQTSHTDVYYGHDIFSRLTILLYLNDDFEGGHTVFYPPKSTFSDQILTSVQPKTGSILIFPQAAGTDAANYAENHWPQHEGSPVLSDGSNRPKYVIRSDVLMTNTPVN